ARKHETRAGRALARRDTAPPAHSGSVLAQLRRPGEGATRFSRSREPPALRTPDLPGSPVGAAWPAAADRGSRARRKPRADAPTEPEVSMSRSPFRPFLAVLAATLLIPAACEDKSPLEPDDVDDIDRIQLAVGQQTIEIDDDDVTGDPIIIAPGGELDLTATF